MSMEKINLEQPYIYVLELEDDNYYVGMTTHIAVRMWQHFHCPDEAAKWTVKHRPKSLVYLQEVHDLKDLLAEEKAMTLRMAKWKGFERVRGGPFAAVSPSESQFESWCTWLLATELPDFSNIYARDELHMSHLLAIGKEEHIEQPPKIWLNVYYTAHDEAKALGAVYCKNSKRWYVRADRDLRPFDKWIE